MKPEFLNSRGISLDGKLPQIRIFHGRTPTLQSKVKEHVGTLLTAGYVLGYLPYKYIAESGKVIFDPGKGARRKLCFHLATLGAYELFLIFRFLQRLANGNASGEGKIRGMFLCSLYLLMNLSQYISLSRYGSYHVFINTFMDSVDKLGGKVTELGLTAKDDAEKFRKTCEKRILYVNKFGLYTCAAMAILRAVKVFVKPRSSEIPTSIFDTPEGLPFVVKLLLGIVQMNVTSFHSYTMFLHGFIINTYINSTLPILLGLRIKQQRVEAGTYSAPRVAPRLKSIDTQLRILQDQFNGTFQLWPLTLELTGGMLGIVRLFLAVRLDSGKDFLVAIAILLLIVILFRSFAEVYDYSKETLETWKILQFPLWFRRYLRTCHPLSIHVGNFCFADKRMVLTLLTIILTNTTSLILTIKDLKHE